VGELLYRGGQCPGVGGGGEAAKAENHSTHRGSGPDRQGPGEEPWPAATWLVGPASLVGLAWLFDLTWLPDWAWRRELVPERGKRLGLAV
jgi:hypothetical protein